jgi:hypothetical protein
MVRIFASVENVSLSGNAVRQSASRNETCHPLRSMNCIRIRCVSCLCLAKIVICLQIKQMAESLNEH